jgi:putative DNA primase/helicase
MIKATAAVDPPTIENIPDQLTERPQWVCWRYEERKGETTKVPYIAGKNSRASSTDLLTWSSFEYALAAHEAGEPPYDGIGFVFCSGDPFVGIDLDHCRNAETGEISPWAQDIISRAQEGYVEASPSGTGVHIIVCGTVRDGKTRKDVLVNGRTVGRIEMYGRAKFFTMTGRTL